MRDSTDAAATMVQKYPEEAGIGRALYPNISEYPEELAFQKGDVLRILSHPLGSELSTGWWLCENSDGKRGIVPANRIQVMRRFDDGFFQVANPLFDDFFMFHNGNSADGGPHYDRRRRLFTGFGEGFFDEALFGGLSRDASEARPLRRVATTDDAMGGVVRNIPIRIQQRDSNGLVEKTGSDLNGHSVRRTHSSGELSPPIPAAFPATSSVAPSVPETTPPTRNIFIGTPANSSSPVERLAQRLRNIGARSAGKTASYSPFDDAAPHLPGNVSNGLLVSAKQESSPSPSSSGVSTDISDASPGRLEPHNERSSDLSSLSGSSSSGNSTATDKGAGGDENDSGVGRPRSLPRGQAATLSQFTRIPASDRRHSSNGSVTPTDQESEGIYSFSAEMNNPPKTFPGPTSTSALKSVFDSIERPNIRRIPVVVSELAQSSSPPPASSSWALPISVAEDMRRNASGKWQTLPTTRPPPPIGSSPTTPISLTTPFQPRHPSSTTHEEMLNRKQVLSGKLQDCLREIELSIERINVATAARGWREAHILQRNLTVLRNAVHTIQESLSQFVQLTSRIAIHSTSSKSDELRALLIPLQDSHSTSSSLRRALDTSGWTLASLVREKDQPRTGIDAIEQFLILMKRLPGECKGLLGWLRLLQPASPNVSFLSFGEDPILTQPLFLSTPVSNGNTTRLVPIQQKPAPPSPAPASKPTNSNHFQEELPSPSLSSQSEESKRLSSSSTTSSTVTSGDSGTVPSSILKQSATQPNGQKRETRVTFADQNHDVRKAPIRVSDPALSHNVNTLPCLDESRILEEDDLESNISERDSLYQDYASLDEDAAYAMKRRAMNGNQRKPAAVGSITPEDRQLVRFYTPQLVSHTDALALAIDDFIDVIEHQSPPREFVQKSKLIILAAHKLIYIGDAVSQCVSNTKLAAEVKAAADRLCSLLKECVSATKIAADDYPNISCVERMVDSIVSVSKAATDLRLLVEVHC